MLTDKDYILKSSRAFVGYVRSFKEHRLSNILKFKNLDVFETARSFFLFKLPVMRDLLDITLETPLATKEEIQKFESVEFLNKNQGEMVGKKIKEAIEKRQGQLVKRAQHKEKLEKEQTTRKVRSKAERNRAKGRETEREMSEFFVEKKLTKQLKQGKLDTEDYDQAISKIDRKHEYKQVDAAKKRK